MDYTQNIDIKDYDLNTNSDHSDIGEVENIDSDVELVDIDATPVIPKKQEKQEELYKSDLSDEEK